MSDANWKNTCGASPTPRDAHHHRDVQFDAKTCPWCAPQDAEREALLRKAYLLGARAESRRGGNPLPALDLAVLLKSSEEKREARCTAATCAGQNCPSCRAGYEREQDLLAFGEKVREECLDSFNGTDDGWDAKEAIRGVDLAALLPVKP